MVIFSISVTIFSFFLVVDPQFLLASLRNAPEESREILFEPSIMFFIQVVALCSIFWVDSGQKTLCHVTPWVLAN